MKKGHVCCALIYNKDEKNGDLEKTPQLSLDIGQLRIFFFLFMLSAFLDTGLPRGNVHERDSGPMRGAIPNQSHNR